MFGPASHKPPATWGISVQRCTSHQTLRHSAEPQPHQMSIDVQCRHGLFQPVEQLAIRLWTVCAVGEPLLSLHRRGLSDACPDHRSQPPQLGSSGVHAAGAVINALGLYQAPCCCCCCCCCCCSTGRNPCSLAAPLACSALPLPPERWVLLRQACNGTPGTHLQLPGVLLNSLGTRKGECA